MPTDDFINNVKRDFGYGRCEDVPDEMVDMFIFGAEDDGNDDSGIYEQFPITSTMAHLAKVGWAFFQCII